MTRSSKIQVAARRLVKRLGSESGQSMTEFALLTSAMILGGSALLKWAPNTIDALNTYMMGIYYIVGTPLG